MPDTPVTLSSTADRLLAAAVASKPGGARRPGQDAMVAAVAEALDSGQHLLVEAPTGTGKSLAYAIPAVARVAALRRKVAADDDDHTARVVISTSTKALQEQLVEIDLPFLADTLAEQGTSFTFAMLKGRSNYLCRAKIDDLAEDESLFGPDPEVDEIVAWSNTTITGERSDLSTVSDRAWGRVSVGPNECPGASECIYGDACFAEDAKARARAADIIVVNSHLYAAHIAAGSMVLPGHDAVVFDEAHELEDIIVSAYSVSITPTRLRNLASMSLAGGGDADAVAQLRGLSDRLDRVAAARLGELIDLSSDIDLVMVLNEVSTAAGKLHDSLTRKGPNAASSKRLQAATATKALRDDADQALASIDAAGTAAWVDGDDRFPQFRTAQIEIADVLRRDLFPEVTVIATSATLTVAGRFNSIAARLGFSDHAELVVASPFDHRRQAILYIAEHLPDPTKQRDQFEVAAREELAALATAAGGRTLALFTSWAATRAAAEHLRANTNLNVLCQGEGSRSELVDQFTATSKSVLVATTSFWTGLDLHGDRCTLVVIDRIPFARPNDPVLVARTRLIEERGGNGFRDVTIPAAAMTLAQGVGRLIRTTSDRGVVAVLDRRLSRERYGQMLISSLPDMHRSNNLERVCGSLSRLDTAAAAA